ncbi:MAG: hypothetical protein GEV12_14255 [Micromonosporaceae bacterium]|nr:hypothetical protein [Micromonosporaceae bacterium]
MRVPIALASLASGVPVRTLRRWAADGRLTVERLGRVYLLDPIEVAELDEMRDGRSKLTSAR